MTGIVQNWGLYSEYKMWCKCGMTGVKRGLSDESRLQDKGKRPSPHFRLFTSSFKPFYFTSLLFTSPYFSLLLFSSLVQTAVLHTPLHASSHSHPFTPILIHKTTKTERGTNTFQTLPNPSPNNPRKYYYMLKADIPPTHPLRHTPRHPPTHLPPNTSPRHPPQLWSKAAKRCFTQKTSPNTHPNFGAKQQSDVLHKRHPPTPTPTLEQSSKAMFYTQKTWCCSQTLHRIVMFDTHTKDTQYCSQTLWSKAAKRCLTHTHTHTKDTILC